MTTDNVANSQLARFLALCVHGYTSTLRKQGLPVPDALEHVFTGTPLSAGALGLSNYVVL